MNLLHVLRYDDLFKLEQRPNNPTWFGAFAAPNGQPVIAPEGEK